MYVSVYVLYKVGRGSQDSQIKVVNERRDEILLAEECNVAKIAMQVSEEYEISFVIERYSQKLFL